MKHEDYTVIRVGNSGDPLCREVWVSVDVSSLSGVGPGAVGEALGVVLAETEHTLKENDKNSKQHKEWKLFTRSLRSVRQDGPARR